MLFKRRSDIDEMLKYVPERGMCVQAGGHVGVWPMRLAESFSRVVTFEADPVLARCLELNCHHLTNVMVHDCALGSFIGTVHMTPKRSSGTWFISDDGIIPVKQVTLDSWWLSSCDLLMLDVERYEVQVLLGAAHTISRFKPVIVVEELAGSRDGIQAHMRDIGYRAVATIHADVVYRSDRR